MAKKRERESDYLEIKRGMRSFAFLRLQGTVSKVRDLLTSVELFNEFPHTMKNDIFFKFAYEKYKKRWHLDFEDESPSDYVIRLDLGRNLDFLHELIFLHLANSFVTYCSDILAVAALGSPEKFDVEIRAKTSRLLSASITPNEINNEVGIIIVSRIIRTPYADLKKLLLSKISLSSAVLKKFKIVDQGIEKRNELTHGLGIAKLAIDIHTTSRWQSSKKVTDGDLAKFWRAIAGASRSIDIAVMRKYDVWRGVDICAPGLYRRPGGHLIRAKERGAYKPIARG
jgi:hypothetical protein